MSDTLFTVCMVKKMCFSVLVEEYGLSDPNGCVYLYITLICPKRKPLCLQKRFVLCHEWESGLNPVGCNPDFQMLFEVFGHGTTVSENILRRGCLQESTGLVCSLTTALLRSWLWFSVLRAQIVTHESLYELNGWFSAGWWEILLPTAHIKCYA